MLTETIPTILMDDERIVDVTFTEWDLVGDEWRMSQASHGLTVDIRGRVNKIVFELPVGCFESDAFVRDGSLTFSCDPSVRRSPLTRCIRSAQLEHSDAD